MPQPIYKCLLAIKTRNGLVLTPHPRAQRSSVAAVRCIVEAAEAAGMPKGLIQVIEHPTQPLTKVRGALPVGRSVVSCFSALDRGAHPHPQFSDNFTTLAASHRDASHRDDRL